MPSALRTFKLFCIYLSVLGWVGWGALSQRSRSDQHSFQNLEEVVLALQQVTGGARLLGKTVKAWKLSQVQEIAKKLQWDRVSRTDTVLTRHYNPLTRSETREREITIFLKKNQSQIELILDLVHELVHATARPSFDPYDPSLTPGQYVQIAIEGEGGEIEAVVTECELAIELKKKFDWATTRCQNYLSKPGQLYSKEILKEKVKQDFYKVGRWHEELVQKFAGEISLFPFLSSQSPRFFSSTGKAPYPMSLLIEFEEITQTACQNSKIRAKSIALASLEQDSFLSKRCH